MMSVHPNNGNSFYTTAPAKRETYSFSGKKSPYDEELQGTDDKIRGEPSPSPVNVHRKNSDYQEEDEDPYFRKIEPPRTGRYTEQTRGIQIERILGDKKDVRVLPGNVRGASTKSLGTKKRPRTMAERKKIKKHNKIIKTRKEYENGGPLNQVFNDKVILPEPKFSKYPQNSKALGHRQL